MQNMHLWLQFQDVMLAASKWIITEALWVIYKAAQDFCWAAPQLAFFTAVGFWHWENVIQIGSCVCAYGCLGFPFTGSQWKKTIPLEPVNSSSSVASRQSTGLVCPSAIATHCRGAVLPPFSPPVGVITPLHKDKQHFKHCCEVRKSVRLVEQVERRMSQQSLFVFKYNVCHLFHADGQKKQKNNFLH